MVCEFKESVLAKDFLDFIERLYEYEPDVCPAVIFENARQETIENIEKPFIEFSCNIPSRVSETLGFRRRYKRKGLIVLKINIPSGSLTNELQKITEHIISHYEGKHLCGVYFRDIVEGSTGTSGIWFFRTLKINFDYDIVK